MRATFHFRGTDKTLTVDKIAADHRLSHEEAMTSEVPAVISLRTGPPDDPNPGPGASIPVRSILFIEYTEGP